MVTEIKPISWKDFIEKTAPGHEALVVEPVMMRQRTLESGKFEIQGPKISIYCPNQTCEKLMFFRPDEVTCADITPYRLDYPGINTVFDYICCNCLEYKMTFAVWIKKEKDNIYNARKIGEWPPFSKPISNKAMDLISSDKDLFRNGFQCESLGFGLGAFSYYRRVVENQWNRLVDEIIKVATKNQASPETIATISSAKEGTQFSKNVRSISDAIPASLMMKGQNPLLLLHNAISSGLHNESDEECLELAASIRAILVELAESISAALRNDKELGAAIATLLKKREKQEKGVPDGK